jgi:hypothetical protein
LCKTTQGGAGAAERPIFQNFADQAYDQNFSRDQRFFQQDGGKYGNGHGKVGTNSTLQKGLQRTVEGASASQNGGNKGQPDSPPFIRPTW